jgi:hypothetical protein
MAKSPISFFFGVSDDAETHEMVIVLGTTSLPVAGAVEGVDRARPSAAREVAACS